MILASFRIILVCLGPLCFHSSSLSRETLSLICFLIYECGIGQLRMVSLVVPSFASSSALSFPHNPV